VCQLKPDIKLSLSSAIVSFMKTRRIGSCHCKAVRFEVELDVTKVTRCNCSICMKLASMGCIVKPADFRLLAGKENLTTYPNRIGGRLFCKTCGVLCFGNGNLPELGGEFVSINVNALDDVDAWLLEPMYWDGRHDNWQAGPRKEPWPVFA
jgi:hypothetical protein